MGYVFLAVIGLISVMMYSVCVVSSRCSRQEEEWTNQSIQEILGKAREKE